MDPRIRDERSKVGTDGRAVASNRRSSVVTALLLFLALGLMVDGIAGERGLLANRRGQEQLELAQQRLSAAKRRNDELRDLIKRLKEEDPATIEDIARRERGFIRPGEKLFIIRDVPKEK
jgi:cell division protein FtsB